MPPPPLHPSLPARPPTSNYNAPLRATAGTGGYGQQGAGAPGGQSSREGTPTLHLPPSANAGAQVPKSGSRSALGGSPRMAGGGGSPFPSNIPGSPLAAAAGGTPRGASPKPGIGMGSAAAADHDPFAAIPPRLKADNLKPSMALVELGEGWKVDWRAWKGPALLFSPTSSVTASSSSLAPASKPPDPSVLYQYDPFLPSPHAPSPFPHLIPRPPLSSSISASASASVPSPALNATLSGAFTPTTDSVSTPSSAQPPPAKKAKKAADGKKSAFDEILAEEGTGESTAPKKKGRVPKAVRDAQAAQAAATTAAAASPASSSTNAPAMAPVLDLPSPSSGLASSATPATETFAPPHASEAGPSVARLVRDRLSSLPTSSSSSIEPILAAQREVARLSSAFSAGDNDDGQEKKDRLALFSWVKVAPVRVGGSEGGKDKGKGKEKAANQSGGEKRKQAADEEEEGEGKEEQGLEGEAEGRTLWVFAVERGWEAEDGEGVDERRRALENMEFEGLEALGSGTLTHSLVFPSLYPSSSTSSAAVNPLAMSANSYPSCLTLSSQISTVPSISHPFPARSHLQAACEAFKEGVRDVVLEEMVALFSPSTSTADLRQQGTAVKLGTSVVYLPPPPAPSFRRLSLPPAASLAAQCNLLPPSLNRSAICLQPSIAEVAYAALPPRIRRGARVLLAPSGVKAVIRKEMRVLGEEEKERLMEDWVAHLPPQAVAAAGEDGWVLCTLDIPSSPKGKENADKPVELIWPRSLVLLDCSPSRRSSSSSRSRSTSRERAEETAGPTSDAEESSSSPQTTPETAFNSLPLSPVPFPYPSPLSPARPPLRPPYNIAFRHRLASQALQSIAGGGRHRRRRSRSTVGDAMEEDGAAADDEGYRDPIKRRTGEVWKWMGEEVRRREDEVEREKEREVERERERTRVAEKAKRQAQNVSPEKKARQVPQPPPPPVSASTPQEQQQQQPFQLPPPPPPTSGPAAPINMRTPMSLGTASTEAPSPAELFSTLGYGSVSAAGGYHPPPPLSSTAPLSGVAPMQTDTTDILSGLGVYPSPAEAPPSTSMSSAPPATTGMTTLDAAFSSFDWGDGTFGAGNSISAAGQGVSGGAGMGGADDFDDGLMLGLTDDDFSFFDAPAPPPASSLPMSMPFDFSGLHDHAHGPHANPLDAFSVSMAPPTTTSPSSVAQFSFAAPYDNALGLSASAPPPPVPTIVPMSAATPPAQTGPQHFPQLPPYSPSILALPNFASASSVSAFPVLPPTPGPAAPLAVSLSPSFATNASVSSAAGFSSSSFDLIPFAPAHAEADNKYDPRKGKFGLPTPDSDEGEAFDTRTEEFLTLLPAATGRRRNQEKEEQGKKADAEESWFSAIYDPRLAMAERLRLARRKSGACKAGDTLGRDGVVRSRGWVRPHRTSKAILALPPPPFEGAEGEVTTGHNSADEASEEAGSSSEGADGSSGGEDNMDIDGRDGLGKDGSHRRKGDEQLYNALGSSLLLLGSSLAGVLQRALPQAEQSDEEDKPIASPVIDQAKEVMLAILTEQVIYNPDFREATWAMSFRNEAGDPLVASRAISLASTSLHRSCTLLSPSSLFSEETSLPPFLLAETPSFLLRTQQCVVQTSAPAVSFWRPMGFEPLTGCKDVTVFAVYEDEGAEMHEMVKAWLRSLSDVYQSLRLGEHALGTVAATGSFSGVQDGLVPLPAGLLTRPHGRDELKLLYATLAEHSKTTQNTVVYILSPFADSPLSPASPVAGILHQINKSRSPLVNMQPCPVHLDHVAPYHPSLNGFGSIERLVSLAFSVYDQLQIPVGRLRIPAPETFPTARPAPVNALGPAVRLFQAPAVTLCPSKVPQIQFSLSWPASSLEVEHRHRFLHICYGSEPVVPGDSSQEWLAVTQIDDRGETWRTIPRYLKIPANVVPDVHRVRVVWSFTKALVDATDVEWRVVVCKLGEPSAVEAKAWDSLLKEHLAVSKRPMHVTFACVDLDPAFAVSSASVPSRRGSATSAISEEGELSFTIAGKPVPRVAGKVSSVFDIQPSVFTFTPAEPISLISFPALAPATTYFVHIPRIPTLTHTRIDNSLPSSPSASAVEPVSVHALHFLLSHASRTSAYNGTLGDLVADIGQSMTELAALGQARWGTSGRLSWHIEAAIQALETATEFGIAAARHEYTAA
ncbi:hypothetical protein JCM11251_002734 [Rhodosporidiobolus azoricus]